MRSTQILFPRGKIVRERYLIEDLLGKGGSSAVYRVQDLCVKGNSYALKELIYPNPYERARLLSEWEILKSLDYPALPRVYRLFEESNATHMYLLMDYIEGPNLELFRLQRPAQRFPLTQALLLLAPIVDALCYLHMQHPAVIHRDIKPANILVPTDARGTMLIDFGIAKECTQECIQEVTTAAICHCSPGYAAPEHYMHETNTLTDLYGLAATLYTLLTGIIPMDALQRIATLRSLGYDPLEPAHCIVPELSPTLSRHLSRALALKTNERFPSVQAFWEAVSACTEEKKAQLVVQTPFPELLSLPSYQPDTLPLSLESHSLFEPLPVQARERFLLSPEKCDKLSSRREGHWILLLPLFTIALLLGGLFFSILNLAHFPVIQRISHHLPAHIVFQKTPVSSMPTPLPTLSVSPTLQPTSLPISPLLASRYDGTMSNLQHTPSISTTVTLLIQQHNSTISGNLTSGLLSAQQGPFIGALLIDNTFQFFVSASAGHLPLLFRGKIHPDSSLSGIYCSFQSDHCNYAGGSYGRWVVYRALF